MARRGAPSLGLGMVLARLRGGWSVTSSIVITTLVAAFLLGAGPRLLETVSTEDLRSTVADPTPAQRNISVERRGRLGTGPMGDPLGPIRDVGERFAETELSPTLQGVISDHYFSVETPRFAVKALPGEIPPHPFDSFLRFRYQEQVEENSEIVAGSLPMPQDPVEMLVGPECPTDAAAREGLAAEIAAGGGGEDLECDLESVPVYEVAVTAETLDALGLDVGDRMMLTPDFNDPLFFGLPTQDLDYRVILSISGLIALTDPELEYWYGDPTLHRPTIEETVDFRIIYAIGLMSPDAVAALRGTISPAPLAYEWRHLVDPDRVTQTDIEVLREDLRRLQLEHSPVGRLSDDFVVTTNLGALLDEFQAQRAETVAMLSLATSGLVAVAIAVIGLLAVLVTARREHSIVLIRNRGASTVQMTTSRFYEALLLVAPAAVAGYYVAKLTVPDTSDLASYRAVVVLAAAGVIAIVISGLGIFSRRLGSLQTDIARADERAARRVVLELLVLVTAVGAILVLRRRGQADTAPDVATFDLLLALTPIIVSVAAGAVLLRIFPLAVGAASRIASLGRGAVTFVSLRRVVGRPAAENLPIAMILMCVSIASLTAITSNSISSGQQLASWQAVGADYRVESFLPGASLPPEVGVDDLDGAEAITLAKLFPGARFRTELGTGHVDVLAIPATEYEQLGTGAVEQTALPDAIETTSEEDPLPAVVSRSWDLEPALSPGNTMTLQLGSSEPTIVVSEVRDRFPGIPVGQPFVVVDAAALEARTGTSLVPTTAYVRAPREASGALAAQLGESDATRLASRYEMLDRLADDPFVAWSTTALEVVFWFAVGFGILASISALALSTSRRRRDLANLRTLGLDTRQATMLTLIEQTPGLAAGVLGGIGAGVATTLLLAPLIVLTGFTGNVLATGLVIDWGTLLILAAALLVAMTGAVAIFMLMNRREQLAVQIRLGDRR